jgi:tetratricopeptide (TPR) repeat protein
MNVDELLSEAIRLENAGARAPAVEMLGMVLAREPRNFEALVHLGTILALEGHHGHAVAILTRAVAVQPNSADTFVKIGDSYLKSQRPDEAAAFYRRALELDASHIGALIAIGFIAEAQGRLDEAAVYRERHLALRPDSAEALQDMGRVLGRRGDAGRAAELLRRGFALEPNRPKLAYELGVAELELERYEDAVAAFRHAVALDPSDAPALSNLGRGRMRLGRWEEALDAYVRAAALVPGEVRYHRNVGAAMVNLGRRDEAIARFDEIVRIDPENPDGHVGRALLLLLGGDFEQGWREYEWRWKLAPFKDARFGRPRWNGTNLAGRSILVSCEQGFGDAIQFIRYIPMLKAQGAVVIVSCQPELMSLFSRSPAIDHVLDNRQPPPATHVYAPLMSLPALFRTDLGNIPGEVPYLFTSGPRVVHWKQKLVSLEGLKVGIAWKGNPEHHGDVDRSVSPDWFARLAAIPGVSLVNLQKGEKAPAFRVTDLADQLTDFAETAAIMKNLDLVIAVDTAVAHLAGALGIPTWVAVPYSPDWRWLLDREDSPWYPTMWLVRQPALRNWQDVFHRIAVALEALARQEGSESE